MISFCKGFAFPHINKNGGTSHIEAFRDFEDRLDHSFVHAPAWYYRDYIGHELWDEFKTFATFRNPLSRMVSSYEYRRQILEVNSNSVQAKRQSFRDWLLITVASYAPDREWGEQLRMVTEEDSDKIIVDRIYLFENLVEDFPGICQWIGVESVDLPHFNKTEKPHWNTYYDQETADFVMQRFAPDFEWQEKNHPGAWDRFES